MTEDKIVAEFTLLVSNTSNAVPLVRQIHNCFTADSKIPNTYPQPFLVTCCCINPNLESQGDVDTTNTPHHAEHFLLFRVPRSRLIHCAALLRPDLSEKMNELELAVDKLTPGQTAWLAELAIRLYQFPSTAFNTLLHFLNRKESGANQAIPYLFTLQRWGLVSDLILRHDKSARRQLFRSHFTSRSLFPQCESLRAYFGDQVGFYFRWMRTYTLCLLAPTCVGLWRTGTSWLAHYFYPPSDDTLTDKDISSPWLMTIRLIYTVFLIFWALVCTKLWSRQHERLVEQWSTNPLLERIANDMSWLFTGLDQRPNYQGTWRISRVTGMWELHFPARKRRWRYLVSGLVITACLIVAGLVNVLLLNLEGYMSIGRSPWFCFECISQFASPGAIFDPDGTGILPYLPGVMHSLLVFVMNQVIFRRIAELLTDYENHQTHEAYDNALIIKRFLFEMIDAYGCLAYLGFILADRTALHSLLSTMLLTDSIRRLTLECLVPLIQYRIRVWYHHRSMGQSKRAQEEQEGKTDVVSPWKTSMDRDLFADPYEPFDDYLEMVLLHGYLVVFAFVSPSMAAPIALVSTFIEWHFDAFKLLWITQRPSPRLLIRQNSIWLALLAAQAWLSILTNVGLWITALSLASFNFSLTPSLLYLLLEHGLVAAGLVIHFCIADTPADVRDARRARDLRRNTLFQTTT